MANPVFANSPQFQQPTMQPVGFDPAQGGPQGIHPAEDRMTYEGVITRAAAFFLLGVASAVTVGMFLWQLTLPIFMVAFVLSLVVSFTARKEPKPALYAVTIVFYGGAAGGLSKFYEATWGGIIFQALIATAVLFAVALAVYRSGRIRNMAKVRRFLAVAVPAYVIFSLVNVAMVWTGGPNIREALIPGTGIPLGLILSIFAIGVGAFMLISDFDSVDHGVRNLLPAKWEWTAAYGLVFAIIWIYLEMLRLLSYLRR